VRAPLSGDRRLFSGTVNDTASADDRRTIANLFRDGSESTTLELHEEFRMFSVAHAAFSPVRHMKKIPSGGLIVLIDLNSGSRSSR
jgi:hypothetical protein